jgi:hypothetical protein
MGTAPRPPRKAMYVAPRPDWDWLRIEQRKLYTRSEQKVDYVFRKLWGLVTDPRNLRMALARVAGNRGRRTAGVDGITAGKVTKRAEAFIAELRSELRSGAYRPSPVRRVLIPKIGAPGKFRPLGRPAGLSSRSIRESRVHNERCTPGSEGGARKPTGESRQGAGRPPYGTSSSAPQSSQWKRRKPCAKMPHWRYSRNARSTYRGRGLS